MNRKPKHQKAITTPTAESPPDPGHKSILQSTLDDFFSREPWRSQTDPYSKFCQRYKGLVLEQAEAESDFIERRIERGQDLDGLMTEALSGTINGLRELVYLATEATSRINALAEAHPEYVANVAANYNAWPVLWTGSSFSKRQKVLLEEIRLGAATPGGVNRRSQGQDPAITRQWAILLLNAIVSLRELQGVKQEGGPSVWNLRGTTLTLEVPKGDEAVAAKQNRRSSSGVFSVGDIANLNSFAQKLMQPEDTLSRHLQKLLSPKTRKALLKCDEASSDPCILNTHLVADLNRIVHGGVLYSKRRFEDVDLRPHVKALAGQMLSGNDLAWFNRLLLEDAYPREIWQGAFTAPTSISIAPLLHDNPDLAEAAKQLSNFKPSTAARWWGVAEQLLRIITRFGVKDFDSLKPFAGTEKVKSLKSSAGTQFNEVVKNIKPVFLNLAIPPRVRSRAAKD